MNVEERQYYTEISVKPIAARCTDNEINDVCTYIKSTIGGKAFVSEYYYDEQKQKIITAYYEKPY